MQNKVKLAIVQMQMSEKLNHNLEKAFQFIRQAAKNNANIVVLPELFESLYFCQTQNEEMFSLASSANTHPFLSQFQKLAKELNIILPISFFEKSGQAYFNSLAMIDNNGDILGTYRKTHIPDGPCYQEKYYFNPGDSGFQVFKTEFGNIGAGICWDQWFPECARVLALKGADIIVYPTAIGSEPPEANSLETKDMWQRAMIGHAVCNSVYIAAPNRVGKEKNMTFYGNSFICNYMGELVQNADSTSECILYSEVNCIDVQKFRAGMGFFRDRRPEHYKELLTLDGN